MSRSLDELRTLAAADSRLLACFGIEVVMVVWFSLVAYEPGEAPVFANKTVELISAAIWGTAYLATRVFIIRRLRRVLRLIAPDPPQGRKQRKEDLALLACLPLFAFAIVMYTVHLEREELRKAGVRVGWLGPVPDDIAKLGPGNLR